MGDLASGLETWACTEIKVFMFSDESTAEGVHIHFKQRQLEINVDSPLFVRGPTCLPACLHVM